MFWRSENFLQTVSYEKILVNKETFDNLVSSLKLGLAGSFTKKTKHDKFLPACLFIKNRKILVLSDSWGIFTKNSP